MQERKLFFREEYQLINIEEIIERENHHSGSTNFRQKLSIDARHLKIVIQFQSMSPQIPY